MNLLAELWWFIYFHLDSFRLDKPFASNDGICLFLTLHIFWLVTLARTSNIMLNDSGDSDHNIFKL